MALLVTTVGSWACGGAVPQVEETVAVDTIDGVVFVESPAVTESTPRMVSRLGGSAGPALGPEVFGRVSSVALSRDGEILIADAQAAEIRVFSAEGVHVRTFGRDGEGPGEFGDLYSLGWLGDTLAVMDPGNARISLHGVGGAYQGQRAWVPLSGPTNLIRLFSIQPGSLYAPYPWFDRASPRDVFLRFQPGTLEPDTVWRERPVEPPPGSLCQLPGGGIAFYANPYAPRELVTPGPGGMIVSAGTGAGMAVWQNQAGDTTRVWSVSASAEPLSAEMWDSVSSGFATYLAENPGAECEPRQLERPASLPQLSGIFFTVEGGLVLERPHRSGSTFDFFSAEGVLEQRVALPPRDDRVAPVFSGRWVLVAEKDDLDVQSVVLYER